MSVTGKRIRDAKRKRNQKRHKVEVNRTKSAGYVIAKRQREGHSSVKALQENIGMARFGGDELDTALAFGALKKYNESFK